MKNLLQSEAGTLGLPLVSSDLDAAAPAPASSPGVGRRWRFTLETLWERKLDEVVALAGGCVGLSAAGDDLPADGASLLSLRLYGRAARASEDLAAIADAIERVDAGTYGLCAGCSQPMPDEWLGHDPQVLQCPACSLPAPRSEPSGADFAAVTDVLCRSNCTTSWPA